MKRGFQIWIYVLLFIVLGMTNSIWGQVREWEMLLKRDPDNKVILLNLGKYYHNLGGMEENKEAVKKADKSLSLLLELEPKHCVAMVYYGSVLTMKARDAFFPWDKMKYVKKGISRMDKAIFFEPGNPEVRLIRGMNSATMPKMFDRLSVALEDLSHIEKLHREKPLEMT